MKQPITEFSQGDSHGLPCNDNVCNEIHILVTLHYLKLF